jgi:hypothetical protein
MSCALFLTHAPRPRRFLRSARGAFLFATAWEWAQVTADASYRHSEHLRPDRRSTAAAAARVVFTPGIAAAPPFERYSPL